MCDSDQSSLNSLSKGIVFSGLDRKNLAFLLSVVLVGKNKVYTTN
jgi:hypothetical protein